MTSMSKRNDPKNKAKLSKFDWLMENDWHNKSRTGFPRQGT